VKSNKYVRAIRKRKQVNLSMLKAYKYRLYPDKEQRTQLSKTFGCTRFVHNYYLDKRTELYKVGEKSISKIDCNNHCNQKLKNEFPWLKGVDKFALTNAIYDLDSAFNRFFRKLAGFPRFKSKYDHHYSYTTNFTNNNIEMDFANNCIKLPKLKKVNCKLHREFDGTIKSAAISQVPSGKYFVSILVEKDNIVPLPQNNNVYAFDLGLKEFLTDNSCFCHFTLVRNKSSNPVPLLPLLLLLRKLKPAKIIFAGFVAAAFLFLFMPARGFNRSIGFNST
jgi:putative transposase